VKTALNAYIALTGALATAIGVDVKAAIALNAETLGAALVKKFGANDVLVALCTKAGVKADATAEAILAGLVVEPDPSKFVPMAAHMALKEQLDTVNKGKPAELVAQALKDKRLLPAQEKWALQFAERDLDGFKNYVGVTPPMLSDAKPPAGGGGEGAHGLTEAQLAICSAMNLDPKAYAETLKLEKAGK
jgi:phage I-like protein